LIRNILVSLAFRRVFFVGLFLFLCGTVAYSEPFRAGHMVTPNVGLVGDVFSYKIDVAYLESVRFVLPPSVGQLGDFKVLGVGAAAGISGDRKTSQISYRLAVYDTGVFEIPTQNLAYVVGDQEFSYLLPALKVRIRSLLPKDLSKVELEAFRGPMGLSLNWLKLILIGVGGIGIAIGCIVIYKWRRRRHLSAQRALASPEAPVLSAREELLQGLEGLKQEKFLEAGESQLYYLKLTELFKGYLSRVFDLGLLEMTTAETLAEIDAIVDAQMAKRIRKVLELSDIAKFAKYSPNLKENEDVIDRVFDLIDRLTPYIEDKVSL